METWEEIRAALDVLLRLLASGLIVMAGFAVKALLPVARAALTEWITTRAWTRWTAAADSRAAAILDPSNPASSVVAQAVDMMAGVKDAAAFLGGTQAAAQAAIERAISARKVDGNAPPVAGGLTVVGR
jgi:hypothetical protein